MKNNLRRIGEERMRAEQPSSGPGVRRNGDERGY
jgi:hypothetical protein